METGSFVYVPVWARRIALVVLGLGCLSGLSSTIYFVATGGNSNADYILAGISLTQISISGLAVALVLFYSEREISQESLLQKTYKILEISLPKRLRQIRLPGDDNTTSGTRPEVTVDHIPDDLGASYWLRSGHYVLRIWVFVNVRRIYVIYFFPSTLVNDLLRLESAISAAKAGAEDVGYRVETFPVKEGNKITFEVRCQIEVEKRFLVDSLESLFWINDIAEMTRAFFLNARREGILPVDENKKSGHVRRKKRKRYQR